MTRRGDFKQKSFLLFLYATICVTPDVEIIETEAEGFLCASPAGGGSQDIDPEDVDPGFGS